MDFIYIILRNILDLMGVKCKKIKVSESKDKINIQLQSVTPAGVLIGRGGSTLRALQYLLNLIAFKRGKKKKINLDVVDYKLRRHKYLENLAKQVAEKVINTGKEIKLNPMTSFERRIIHTALQKNENVKTYSVGSEPRRYVVISPSQ